MRFNSSQKAKPAIFFFHELGLVAAVVALLLAMFGRDVRYLKLIGRAADDRAAAVLAQFGVRALTYEEVPGGESKHFKRVASISSRLYREFFLDSPLEYAVALELGMNATDRDRFSIACEHHLLSDTWEYAELLVFADSVADNSIISPRIRLITSGNHIVRKIISWERAAGKEIDLISWPSFTIFDYTINGFRKYLRYRKNGRQSRGDFPPKPNSEQFHEGGHEILFFPHKGIYYGNLFVKDHYYANDIESPFHPTKILHLSLGESPEARARSDLYYVKHGIPNVDLHSLANLSLRRLVVDFLILLWRNRRKLFVDHDHFSPALIFFFFARYCHLRFYLSSLAKLAHAKIALVGYDILFPPILSVALAMRGVATVATQERFSAPFQGIYRLMFDYYLPIGSRVCRFLADHPRLAKIGRCDPIGPVRAGDILSHGPSFPAKYAEIKRNRKLILALDFHSESTVIANARAMSNNWKENKSFYLNMIRLAVNFPQAYIVIKGKNTTAVKLDAMQDIMAIIKCMPNISIEEDLDAYPPSLMAAMADITVAYHTSLLDEILAVGKRGLVCDFVGYLTGYFEYDNYPIIVRTYSDLELRIEAMLNGNALMDEETFSKMRRDYYAYDNKENSVRTDLQLKLKEIYAECARAVA